jgi:hypothetical protein
MNFKQKRQYKRRAKTFIILAYAMIIVFVIDIVSGLVYVSTHHKPLQYPELQLIPYCTFIFLGIIFAFIGDMYQTNLIKYLRNIKKYRSRKFFQHILDLVDSGKLVAAISLYNSMPQGELKDYLFGILINESKYSDNPGLVKQGDETKQKLRDRFSPEKIKF